MSKVIPTQELQARLTTPLLRRGLRAVLVERGLATADKSDGLCKGELQEIMQEQKDYANKL